MSVRITPFMTLAETYASLLGGWQGDLVVHTVHGTKKTHLVASEDTLDLTEVGVLVNWRGDSPTGKFIPWSEVTSIDQASEDAESAE